MYLLYNEWLINFPTILDSLFHGLINTANTSIGVEDESVGKPQSGEFLWFQKLNTTKLSASYIIVIHITIDHSASPPNFINIHNTFSAT